MAYNGFCKVVGNQLFPNLLPDKFCLIRVEAAQADRVLGLAERCFNPPSGKIKTLDVLCGEFFCRKVGHNTFERTISQWKSHNPNRDRMGIA